MTHSDTRPRAFSRSLLSIALGGCLAMAAPALLAQSTAATIRGQVMVDSTPATDARVTAVNTATGLTRSVQVSGNGNYNVVGLPPGTYRLQVEANGQSTSQTVTVAVGQTATLNLGVGGVAETATTGETQDLETVSVTAPAAVETKTSEVATYVSQKQIDSLPQNSRNFLSFADIVPGVTVSNSPTGASIRSGAQVSNAVNVFIDGVGQKDYVLKGGISGQDSTPGNPFPQLGIAEYKVVSSNYKAEYDQLSSAGISAVTKSGTNEFEGQFFWDNTAQDFRAKTADENYRGRDKVRSGTEHYGVAIGGPILMDRLHYFVTYEAKEIDRVASITPGRNRSIDSLPSPYREEALATTGSPFKEDLFFGKLSWTPGDAHLVEFTAKYREEDDIVGVDGINTFQYGTSRAGEETRLDLRYQYSAENWLNDAHITFEDATFGPQPLTIAPGRRLLIPAEGQETVNNPNMSAILNIGGGPDQQQKGQKGLGFQNDFTWFGFEGHTIKAGIKYKQVDISALQRSPPNAQYFYDLSRNIDVPYQVQFTASGLGTAQAVVSENEQLGLYIQDDWEATDRLTINLGVRWDYETTPSYEDHVTPQAVLDALAASPGLNAPGVDYDYRQFVSTGNERSATKGNFQPRVGFSYDFSGDESFVLFGGAGRSYNRNQFDYLAREQYGLAFQRYTYQFNQPGHVCRTSSPQSCLDWDPSYLDQARLDQLAAAAPNVGSEVFLIDNDLKTPYSDQFSLGVRNVFEMGGQSWNSSATLLHVLSHDGILFTAGNRRDDGSFYEPGRTFGGIPPANLPGFGRLLIGRNAVETRLNSVLLSLDKPFTNDSGWGTTIAYTYSDAVENRNNSDTFSFDYRDLDDVAFTRAIGIPRHRLVTTGIYDIGWGMTLSGKFEISSPAARESQNCIAIDTFNCFFDSYYPDTSVGFKQFDVALQKEWDTGTDIKLRVRADVLNVFNWYNWTDYIDFRGDGRDPSVPGSVARPNEDFGRRNPDSFATAFPPRTFKLTFGINW